MYCFFHDVHINVLYLYTILNFYCFVVYQYLDHGIDYSELILIPPKPRDK